MTINCLIIEDEIPNANRLEKLLGQTDFEVAVLEKLATIKDTLIWLKGQPKPDLLLLDVRLSDGISFEIFKQIEIDIPIIFTTAYDEYAIQAFKVNSIDYLLKPILLADLNAALHKFAKKQMVKPENDLTNLLNQLKVNEPNYRNRFLITFREQYIPIDINQVAYFYSQNKITYLITHKNEHYIIDLTMERLEEELDPKQFFRASRQLIVKQESIQKISTHFNAKIKLDLLPALDTEVILSREKSSALKEWLNK